MKRGRWLEFAKGVREWVESTAPPPPAAAFTPRSRVGLLLQLGAQLVAALILFRVGTQAFKPFFAVPAPRPIPQAEPPGVRFGLPDATRKAIFVELAAAEIADRDHDVKANTWKGHAWSQEDDRGYRERALARALATRYGVTLSQIYLAFEEGIHERWPGPDGKPLTPTVPPLDLRHE